MPDSTSVSDLQARLSEIVEVGSTYLQKLEPLVEVEEGWHRWPPRGPSHFWDQIPEPLQNEAKAIDYRFLPIAKEVIALCKRSSLVDPADIRELQVAAKSVRSNLRLRNYSYSDGEAVHDEGTVLGYSPPSQSEGTIRPKDAEKSFRSAVATLQRILELADDDRSATLESASMDAGSRYRRDTAFIMMWMDPNEAELEDIRDAVREVFDAFGIRAIRADDVEHDGVITERIINEIKNSEFLLADLTGARPSVYYEVGYAHALGKRVILYRKEGTRLHFDLAGYNCPEYRNIRDLKEKLSRRLEQMTNRKSRT